MGGPLILAFDTSAAHCAAALLSGDRVIGQLLEPMEKGQAERLMPLLEGLLADAGLVWRDLSRIAVGTGPGNFTGVRIGVSAARGLALGLGVPAVGVSRFEAMAYGHPRPVSVVYAARRDEVHVQSFTETGPGPARMAPALDPGVPAGPVVGLSGEPPLMPLAEAIARVALSRGTAPQPRPAPLYIRAADAAPPSDPPPRILPDAP